MRLGNWTIWRANSKAHWVKYVDDHDLAAQLLKDHLTASAALIALMLKNLPDEVRTRTLDAVRQRRRQGRATDARGVERDGTCPRADGWVGGALACADARLLSVTVLVPANGQSAG